MSLVERVKCHGELDVLLTNILGVVRMLESWHHWEGVWMEEVAEWLAFVEIFQKLVVPCRIIIDENALIIKAKFILLWLCFRQLCSILSVFKFLNVVPEFFATYECPLLSNHCWNHLLWWLIFHLDYSLKDIIAKNSD